MSADLRRGRVRKAVAIAACAVVSATAVTVLPATAADAAAYKKANNGSRIVAFKWLDRAKTRFDVTVQSAGLGKRQKVRVLVPKGWKRTAKRTWPTVYALHGGRANYTSWTKNTDIEQLARKWQVLVVMPEGANGSYTDWYNDGKFGRPKWETFHMREVVQLMQRNFRAGGARATMGLSSGAQGACTYPGRFPGMFRYAACFSGILSMQAPGIPAILMYTASGTVKRPERIWGDHSKPKHRRNWDKHDPIKLLPKMKKTRFYVSAGTTGRPGPFDPPNLPPLSPGRLAEPPMGMTTQRFLNRARQLGVRITAHIYANGTHSWPYWRREMHTSWPQMMQTLGARRA